MNWNEDLTAREKIVLTNVGKGCTREYIAELLNVEKTTVDKHIEAIYRKYEVHEKGGAILLGLLKNDLDFDTLVQAHLEKKKK